MGISRITPSVKGKDSILNGIAKISEYKIYVSPACVNMINELSTYSYKAKSGENGVVMPEDHNNHLCDAMRYAFEDVRFFKAEASNEDMGGVNLGIARSDFRKGWDL